MTRQEQFKAEMAAIFAKYKVEMDVTESTGYDAYPTGVSFWSYTEWDTDGNVIADPIDFSVGTRSVNASDFQ